MSITFDHNYSHSICCQTGAYEGWHLVVNESLLIHGSYPRATVHKSKEQNWNLLQADGAYKITYGEEGKYRGWFLSYVNDEKDEKVGHLCLKPSADQNAFWVFDLIKNFIYDYAKRIVRNSQNNYNLRIINNKKYLVSKEQFFALIHKNSPIAIKQHGFMGMSRITYLVQDSSGNFTWRVQKTELSYVYEKKKQNLQNKLERLESELSQKEKEKESLIADTDKKNYNFTKLKKQTEQSIAESEEEIKKFVERNAFLEAEILLMEKWKTNYQSKQKQLEEYTNNFNLRKQQLKMDIVNYTRLKEDVQNNLPRKTKQLETIKEKVSKLNDFEGKEVSLKNFWLEIFELQFQTDEKLIQLEKAKNLQNKMILQHEEYLQKLYQLIESNQQPDKINEQFDSVMQENNNLKFLVEKMEQQKNKLDSEYRKLVEQHYETVESSRKEYESLRSQIRVLEDQNSFIEEQVFKQKLKFEYFKRLMDEDNKTKTVKNLFGALLQPNIQTEKQSLKAQILELKAKLLQEFNIETDQQDNISSPNLNEFQQNNEHFSQFNHPREPTSQKGQQIFDVKKRVKNQMLSEKYQLLVKEDESNNEFENFYYQLKKKRLHPNPNQKRFYELRRQRRTQKDDWKIEENFLFESFENKEPQNQGNSQKQKNPFANLFSFFENEGGQPQTENKVVARGKKANEKQISQVLKALGKKYLVDF